MKKSHNPDDVLRGILPGGSVQPYIRGFTEHLLNAGYSFLSTRDFARSASHLGRWIDMRGFDLAILKDHHLELFEHHRCDCPGASRLGQAPSRKYCERVRRFVHYLRKLGVVLANPRVPYPEIPAPLVGFREWMLRNRGVRVQTVDRYEGLVLKMLPRLGDEPADYDAALIRLVVIEEIRGLSPGYAKTFVIALRAFLRFLEAMGRCRTHLYRAIPNVPQWTLSSLPHHLDSETVEHVIDSCDLDKPHGVRDRAVLLLLARLGLRVGDIVNMRLGDINWTQGTLRVRGKSRREVVLPLPQDAGNALLRYMVDVRPDTDIDHVFFCSNAPVRPLAKNSTVSSIVMLALRRAGITDAPSRGAHLLRHSAAVSMLRSGVSVATISTVLRHSSMDMTAYYAKVDVALLENVAQPWPDGTPC